MKLIKIIIGGVLVLGIGVGIFAIAKMGAPSSSGDSDDESTPNNVPALVSVQVGTIKSMTLHHYVTGYGSIDAAPATVNEPAAGGPLAAPSAGVVATVNVVPGQHVEKGDVLAELNSGTASFDSAKAEMERQEKLAAQQNTSLKNVQDAKVQLESLEVIAPVSGTVTSVNVKPGQAIDSTTIVAEVIDLDRLAITAKIPVAQADGLQAGQEMQILTEPPVNTSLSFVSPVAATDDGTVFVWAALPSGSPGSQLRPGQFVQFKIDTTAHTNCLVVPAESVVTDDNGNSTVSLVVANASVQTPVQVGFREGDWVEVSSPDLKEGSQIVTVGAYGLADKTQLKVITPADETTNSPAAQ
jgi:membrane fusion protein, multidrug efflux system